MITLSLSDILDDLRTAEEGLHKFEQRYWISSAQFYDLYSKGLLDDGENAEDFSEWAGHYRLREKRQAALETLSQQRMKALRTSDSQSIRLHPAEPTLRLG